MVAHHCKVVFCIMSSRGLGVSCIDWSATTYMHGLGSKYIPWNEWQVPFAFHKDQKVVSRKQRAEVCGKQ